MFIRFYHFISHVFRQTHSPEPHSRWRWRNPSQMRYYYYLSFVFHWTTTGRTKTEAAHTNSANTPKHRWACKTLEPPRFNCAQLHITSNSAHRFLLVHLFFCPASMKIRKPQIIIYLEIYCTSYVCIRGMPVVYIVSLTQKVIKVLCSFFRLILLSGARCSRWCVVLYLLDIFYFVCNFTP